MPRSIRRFLPPRGWFAAWAAPALPVIAAVLLSLAPLEAQAPPTCGNCDQDSTLSVLDSLRMAQIAAGLFAPASLLETLFCDANQSGAIDILDALLAARLVSGLPVTLPPCGETLGATEDLHATVGFHMPDLLVDRITPDASLDIVTLERSSSEVAIYPGPSFLVGSRISVSVPAFASALASGDVDGDMDLDVCVAHAGTNGVTLLRNNDPLPTYTQSTIVSGLSVPDLAMADVDGDMDIDICALTTMPDELKVIRQDFGGILTPLPGTPAVVTGAVSIVVANLDLDADLEIAVLGSTLGNVQLFDNVAEVLTPIGSPIDLGLGAAIATELTVASLSEPADTLADLAVGSNDTAVRVLFNMGSLAFSVPASAATDGMVVSLATGRIDGDMLPDLITCNPGTGEVTLLSATGAASPAAPFNPTIYFQSASIRPQLVRTADLNGDSRSEVIFADATTMSFAILHPAGNLAFKNVPAITTSLTGGALTLLTADITGNSAPDLITTDVAHAPDFAVLENDGQGGFTEFAISGGPGADSTDLAMADFDDDGDLDIAVAYVGMNIPRIFLNDGTPAPSFTTIHTPTGGCCANASTILAVIDVLHDGISDLLVSGMNSTVLLNDGAANFTTRQIFAASPTAADVTVMDIDGDLDDDFVTSGPSGATFFQQDALGNFSQIPGSVMVGSSGACITSGDLDGDGVPEIVVGGTMIGSFDILSTAGGGVYTLLLPATTSGTLNVSEVQVTDFDQDGDQDIVGAVQGVDRDLVVFANRGLGGPLTAASFGVRLRVNVGAFSTAEGLAIDDFDGDGIKDAAISAAGSTAILLASPGF